MKERWRLAGVLAGALFVVNIIARVVVRLAAGKDDGKQVWIGLIELIAVGLLMVFAGTWWVRRFPMPRVFGDLGLASLAAALLSSLVGPFISRGKPFDGGFGYVFTQVVYYLAFCGLGALFGALAIMMAGQDYKSQSWKRYAETIMSRPRRAVRR